MLFRSLFAGEEPPLTTGQACDRLSFHTIIRDQYRKINDFEGYYKSWGAVQSVAVAQQLNKNTVKSQYAESVKKYQHDCEIVFETHFSSIARRMKGWLSEWHSLSGKKSGNPIAEEANSFRGSSALQCGLYDLTESYEGDRFKTYELPGILSNLQVEMWSKKGFLDELNRVSEQLKQPIAKGRFNY